MSALSRLRGAVANAIRGRLGKNLGRVASQAAISTAIGAGFEIGGIVVTEYQLQSILHDLPRAMDEMMRSIADHRVVLDKIKTALLRTRIQSALARFVARVGELKGLRLTSHWFTALIIMQMFSELITEVYKALWDVTIARMQRFALIDLSDQQYERTGDMILQNLLNEWKTKDPVEMAQINMKEFIDLQNDLTALSTYFDAIGRTSALGQWLGFSAIARTITNVSWAFGIGWLSWVAIGPGMRATIAGPLEKYYNKLLRQTDLPRETVLRLWRKGLISDEELQERLAVLGHPDRDIELLKKDELQTLPRETVLSLWKKGLITEEELRKRMATLGYSPEDIELLKKLEVEALPRETVLNLWKKGLITDEELEKRLKALGYVEEDIELLRKAETEFFTEAQIVQMLETGLIDESEAKRMLARLGWREPELTMRLELIEQAAKAKLKERLISKLESAFTDGLVGYEDIYRARALDLKTVTLEQLRNYILTLELEVNLAQIKLKTIQERFLDGTIDEETLRAQLADVIAVPEVLEAIVENLKARKEPKRAVEREETLERRKRTLEARLQMLYLQISHQIKLRNDALALIDVRRNRIIAERDEAIRRLQALADARIRALEEEFQAMAAAREAEIEARIRELRQITDARVREIQAELEARKNAIDEELEVIRTATAIEIEERIRMLEQIAATQTGATQQRTLIRIQYLEEVKDLPVLRREALAEARKRRLEEEANAEIERIRAVAQAREELLRAMATVRIEERRAVLDSMINRIESEVAARIDEIQKRAAARLEELEAQAQKVRDTYQARIEALTLKAEQLRQELEIIEEALAKR